MNLAKILTNLSFLSGTSISSEFTAGELLGNGVRKIAQYTAITGLFFVTSLQGFAALSYTITDLGEIPFDRNSLLNVHCFTDNGFLVTGFGDTRLYDLNSATPLAGYQLAVPEGYNLTKMEIVGV
jgi:hypothetical protein